MSELSDKIKQQFAELSMDLTKSGFGDSGTIRDDFDDLRDTFTEYVDKQETKTYFYFADVFDIKLDKIMYTTSNIFETNTNGTLLDHVRINIYLSLEAFNPKYISVYVNKNFTIVIKSLNLI